MKILILKNKNLSDDEEHLYKILDYFKTKKLSFDIKNIEDIKNYNRKSKYDLVVSLGGDGTIIKSAKVAYYMNIPIIGINAGHLGFLSGLNLNNDIKSNIEKLYKSKFKIEKRFLLEVNLYRDNNIIFQDVGINDIYSLSSNLNEISIFDIKIKNNKEKEFFNITDDLRACGVIVASPTGSTGFSFSLDGPIISPSVNCFIIKPIYPHTFNQRPIIIDDKKIIKISILKDNQSLIVDGYKKIDLKTKDEIVIKKSKNYVKFIELSKNLFFKNLQNKMKNF